MGSWHKVIGIDLGTTFSAVAAYNFDRQEVRIIPNRQNEPTTPSVVYVSSVGQVSVGRAAKEKMGRDPGGVIIEVKRKMGDAPGGTKAMVQLNGRDPLDPEFISAHILKELKACAEKVIGEPVHDAVITVPAYFKESQKNATQEAARIAKLNPVLIINEPTAAAVTYAIDSGEKQTFLVYDFGGGTFDVSIVRANSERSFDVLGTGGDARLGGGDVDQRIVDWALAKMRQQHGKDFSSDAKLMGRLRLEAERVKINLCNEGAGQDLALDATADSPEVSYRLEPAEFEALVQPLVERTLKEVDVALASANRQHGLTLDDVEAFILVGGSSKIPLVSKVLRDRFHKPIKSDVNPDEVVAIGAGWMAKKFTPSLGPVLTDNAQRQLDPAAPAPRPADHRDIKDVVSHTLGVGLKDDVFDPLIPKDSVIPDRVTRDGYTTAEDNQTTIYVPVCQGENTRASLNTKLGEVVISGLTPEPKGTHRFTITFGLDANGIFSGEIKHHQTGATKEIKLDRGQGQMTEKRRLHLSQLVSDNRIPGAAASAPASASTAGPAATSRDPLEELVRRATELLDRLPPGQQQEIRTALGQLDSARAHHNAGEIAAAFSHLTMAFLRSERV